MARQVRPTLCEPAGTLALRCRFRDQGKGSGFPSGLGSVSFRQQAGYMAAVDILGFAHGKIPLQRG